MAFAGRRAQSLGGHPDDVAARIRRLLADLRPAAVVGAAADGTDLLVLEAALACDPPTVVHVVLPTARRVFAADSVEPRWRDRFSAALGRAVERGGTVRALDAEPGDAAYRAANQAILDTALGLAGGEPEAVLALVVGRDGEGAMVEDLLDRARSARVPSRRIDPSR